MGARQCGMMQTQGMMDMPMQMQGMQMQSMPMQMHGAQQGYGFRPDGGQWGRGCGNQCAHGGGDVGGGGAYAHGNSNSKSPASMQGLDITDMTYEQYLAAHKQQGIAHRSCQ